MVLAAEPKAAERTALSLMIGDAERRRDRGMFFGSIHATLNHLLYIDHRILGILNTGQAEPFNARTIMADDHYGWFEKVEKGGCYPSGVS